MADLLGSWPAVLRAALAEDLGEAGDVTSAAVIPVDATLRANVVFHEEAVLCGTVLLEAVFAELGDVAVEWFAPEGALVAAGTTVGSLEGSARAVLAGERTALNLMSHLSGVATRTARFVAAVAGTGAAVFDTRKTTPGLRELDKYAVRVGGGHNHRMGLFDGVLIKDNHLALAGGVAAALARAREAYGDRYPIEAEVESVEDARRAAEAGADIVMLDNMSFDAMAQAVRAVDGRAEVEASGGITEESARRVAETGVDRIAVGALTRGAGVDVALDVI